MKIKDMFYKEIDRDIKGVIKVGQADDENVYQELDEYVVTSELESYMMKFFQAYINGLENRTDKMGVWISGFFGSGKSHFLKILSYLLDNNRPRLLPSRRSAPLPLFVVPLRASLLLPLRVSPFSPFRFSLPALPLRPPLLALRFSRFSPSRRSPLLRRSGFPLRPSPLRGRSLRRGRRSCCRPC